MFELFEYNDFFIFKLKKVKYCYKYLKNVSVIKLNFKVDDYFINFKKVCDF